MDEEIKVIRVDSTIHEQAKKVARENHLTLSGFTEKALKNLMDEYKYNYSILMKLVSKTPSLILYEKIFEKEFLNAPRTVIKSLIRMIESGDVTFHKITLDKKAEDKLKGILSDQIKDIVVIVKIDTSIEPDDSIDKIPEILKTFDTKGIRHLALKTEDGLKNNGEVLIVISYKKEGEGDGKKK